MIEAKNAEILTLTQSLSDSQTECESVRQGFESLQGKIRELERAEEGNRKKVEILMAEVEAKDAGMATIWYSLSSV